MGRHRALALRDAGASGSQDPSVPAGLFEAARLVQSRHPNGASCATPKATFNLYAKNRGLVLDLMILLQTVEVASFHRGSH